MVHSFFVYGTLKRGQVREGLWPLEPESVQPAIVRGALFGRADYPAMTPGNDLVRGERWTFTADQMPRVTAALDRIEGTNQPGQADLYYREVVPVLDARQQPIGKAYVYFYASDPTQDGFVRVQNTRDGQAFWPANE